MTIHCGDAVQWAKEYRGPLHHALLCDPPYHLTSITKRFGKAGAAPAQEGTDGVYRRASAGFMGQEWDGGDVAFQPETWAAFSEVLYPGAFLMAFAGSRGWHRMAVAIEDAGFVIHPTIFLYTYGSGFPKATRVKAGEYVDGETIKRTGKESGVYAAFAGNHPERIPASDMAKIWAGHRYGMQAMKPAAEPIIVAQKPYEGRPVDCITRTGAGALNIEAGRVGSGSSRPNRVGVSNERKFSGDFKQGSYADGDTTAGRWPANFIVGDEAAAAMLDRQSGHLQSGKPCGLKHAANAIYGQYGTEIPITGYGDSGGASRFFFNVQTAIDEADPVIYCAKAGSGEREKGLERFMQTERAGVGALRDGVRETEKRANVHPTVKSLSLTRHLASLLLPPAEYAPRRLYVPFSGVASEMCGADLAGWEEVNGVEQSTEYCRIGEARRRFWICNSGLFEEIAATVVTPTGRAGAGDAAAVGGLFGDEG